MSDDERTLPISVVIETVNEETGPDIDLDQVLGGLARQSYAQDLLEILVVIDAENPRLGERLRARHPAVKIVLADDPAYFPMKVTGARHATGDVVAFLDSDTLPSEDWARAIADTIAAGADVVAGKTRYPRGAAFARTFDFFNFGYVKTDSEGRASDFLPNNMAIRSEIFQRHPFDPRARRSGAAHLLGKQLLALGYALSYQPRMAVTHNAYSPLEQLRMRVKSGYDCVNLSRWDETGVLEEGEYLKRGPLALPLVFARRVIFDLHMIRTNREDLGLSLADVPYFLCVSPAVRSLEMGAAFLTLVRPDYLAQKFGW